MQQSLVRDEDLVGVLDLGVEGSVAPGRPGGHAQCASAPCLSYGCRNTDHAAARVRQACLKSLKVRPLSMLPRLRCWACCS